jgi:hypothetical protein
MSAKDKLITKIEALMMAGHALEGTHRKDDQISSWRLRCDQILSLLGERTRDEFRMTGAMMVAYSGMTDAHFELAWQGERVEKLQFLAALKEKLELFDPAEETEIAALRNALTRLNSKPGT